MQLNKKTLLTPCRICGDELRALGVADNTICYHELDLFNACKKPPSSQLSNPNIQLLGWCKMLQDDY